ncbi:FRG domain-containing protein [Chelatococcus sambhunathii]|uniref:FRG domain-containing protein n=1 Tax=Chelatococcus sambhunathii TaxID=363953 RepID=A0ABU1DJZ8_9HYPH|nr:FRG domain-containing protein [Chelatococcus sambhunathii]MDR4308406.1 FRG domain-containing protein [Chelatococcus sambhunathii]
MAVGTNTHTVQSLSQYLDLIQDNLPVISDGFYTYRGERRSDWKIAPGIMRDQFANLLENERHAVREIVSIHPNEFRDDHSMFDRLVRMQHFNLPTRLLDVTGNPLVALFNATEEVDSRLDSPSDGRVYYISIPDTRRKFYDSDAISCVANLANLTAEEKAEILANMTVPFAAFNEVYDGLGSGIKAVDRLLQFIRMEKPSFRPLIKSKYLDRLWYVVPKLSNRRIIAQNGAFLIFGLTDRPNIPESQEPIQFRGIVIPANRKREIRKSLATLGITESALFPEIDKAAGFIVEKYRQ